MNLLKELLEAKCKDDEPKDQTTTKTNDKVDLGDLLNKPRPKGDLAKAAPKEEPGEEPTLSTLTPRGKCNASL